MTLHMSDSPRWFPNMSPIWPLAPPSIGLFVLCGVSFTPGHGLGKRTAQWYKRAFTNHENQSNRQHQRSFPVSDRPTSMLYPVKRFLLCIFTKSEYWFLWNGSLTTSLLWWVKLIIHYDPDLRSPIHFMHCRYVQPLSVNCAKILVMLIRRMREINEDISRCSCL